MTAARVHVRLLSLDACCVTFFIFSISPCVVNVSLPALPEQVLEVEEEMRVLLSENEASRRDMEDKFKKLTRAMTDIQQGLF